MSFFKKKGSGRGLLGFILVLAVLALSIFGGLSAASAEDQPVEKTTTATDTPAPKDDSSSEAPAAPETKEASEPAPTTVETPESKPAEEKAATPDPQSESKPETKETENTSESDETGTKTMSWKLPEGVTPNDSWASQFPQSTGTPAAESCKGAWYQVDTYKYSSAEEKAAVDALDDDGLLTLNELGQAEDAGVYISHKYVEEKANADLCEPTANEPEASATWICDSVTVHNDYTDAAKVTIAKLDQDGKVVPGTSKDYPLAAGADLTRSDLTKGTWDVLVRWDSSEDAVFEEMHEVTGCDTPPVEPQDTEYSAFCGGFTVTNPEGNPELKVTYSDASQGGANSTSITLAGGEESDPIYVDYTSAHVVVEGTGDTEYFDEYNITIPQDCGEEPGEGDMSVKSGCGFVDVTNNEDESMQFLYGSFKNVEPDGTVNVEAGKTAKVKTTRSSLDYVAYFDQSGKSNQGTVKVKQHCDTPPKTDKPDQPKLTTPPHAGMGGSTDSNGTVLFGGAAGLVLLILGVAFYEKRRYQGAHL